MYLHLNDDLLVSSLVKHHRKNYTIIATINPSWFGRLSKFCECVGDKNAPKVAPLTGLSI